MSDDVETTYKNDGCLWICGRRADWVGGSKHQTLGLKHLARAKQFAQERAGERLPTTSPQVLTLPNRLRGSIS